MSDCNYTKRSQRLLVKKRLTGNGNIAHDFSHGINVGIAWGNHFNGLQP